MMMNFNSDLLYSGDITVDQLVTTAWQSDFAFGTYLEKSLQTYSWDTTEDKFVYTNNAQADSSAFEPNFIEYIGSAEHKLDFTSLGFEKGDRVIASIEEPTQISVDGSFIKNAYFVKDKQTYSQLPKSYRDKYGEWGVAGLEESLPWLAVEFASTPANTLEIAVAGPSDFTKSISYPTVTTDVTLLTLNADELGTELVDGTWKVTVNGSTATIVVDEVDTKKYENQFWIVSNVSDDALEVVSLSGTESIISAVDTVKKCNLSCSITNHNLSPIYFEGYVYEHDKPVIVNPETKEETPSTRDIAKLNWHNFLLGTLTDYEGIRTALTNRKDIDYRYIVDTFEGLVDTELHKELALIAKEKDNAVAFLNFPSVKTFKNCTYSSFTDDKGKFQVKYIKEGANKQKQPAKLFSLVSEINGASYVSYNTPLIFTDGAVKTEVPSAALVSNNFMDKYTSRQPYYVVAGPTYEW